jgi:hypothetical protein
MPALLPFVWLEIILWSSFCVQMQLLLFLPTNFGALKHFRQVDLETHVLERIVWLPRKQREIKVNRN